MTDVPDFSDQAAAIAALRPSEYTAALIQVLQRQPARVCGAIVLEIGTGSGVVLAALGALGAASLCGVDVEAEAIESCSLFLRQLGYAEKSRLRCGDMWLPFAGERFDLIVANLPHFAMDRVATGNRRSSWSSGGASGRDLLDPFLAGLADRLAPGGRAVITHNAFVGLERSREIAARHGLALRVAMTVLVYVPAEKLALMTRGVLAAEVGRTIHRYGPYTFAELHIVELDAAETSG